MQFPFFSSLAVIMLKLKTDNNGALVPSVKIQKFIQQTFREEYQTNEWMKLHKLRLTVSTQNNVCSWYKCPCVIKSSPRVLHNTVMYAVLNSLSFMLRCVMLLMHILFSYQNMCIMGKIWLLHLKSNFITLRSSEGLAGLFRPTWVMFPESYLRCNLRPSQPVPRRLTMWGDVMVYVFEINQPSLSTPFYSVLVSVSVIQGSYSPWGCFQVLEF